MFCFNIIGDLKNFVQISTISVLFYKIYIWPKSQVRLTAQKGRPARYGNGRTRMAGLGEFFFSRVLHVKTGWRLNVTNKFDVKDDFQFVLLLSCSWDVCKFKNHRSSKRINTKTIFYKQELLAFKALNIKYQI